MGILKARKIEITISWASDDMDLQKAIRGWQKCKRSSLMEKTKNWNVKWRAEKDKDNYKTGIRNMNDRAPGWFSQ